MKVRIGRLAVLGYLVVALQAAAGGFPVPGYAAGPDLVLAVALSDTQLRLQLSLKFQ